MTPFVVTLTGPSCAGKSTLEKALRNAGFANVISTTTRPPRAGEVDGESYYFIDKSEFKRLRDTGAFVESVEFNGNYYAVSAKEVERVAAMNVPIVVIVEPVGLEQIRKYAYDKRWELLTVFIDNPASVIAARFLERFLTDVAPAHTNVTALEKVVHTYAQRLAVMMSVEASWSELEKPLADLYLPEFNENNMALVVQYLLAEAANTLNDIQAFEPSES